MTNQPLEINRLEEEVKQEFLGNILPYWKKYSIDTVNDGFIGRVTSNNHQDFDADKGIILNTRILWTFSAAQRFFPEENLSELAFKSLSELRGKFWDHKFGGLYWSLNAKGQVVDNKKLLYAQAFGIYSFSEAYGVFGWEDAKEKAIELFDLVHTYARDERHGGYFEACNRNWQPLNEIRLSKKDLPSVKTMNTHLHLMEAFTCLYKYIPLEHVRQSLSSSIHLFLDRIINQDYYLNNYMDEQWNPISDSISYGHNIEASWLLLEAAEVLGDEEIIQRIKHISVLLAEHVLVHGYDQQNGGIYNEGTSKNYKSESKKDWWSQAEAVIGFLNAFELTQKDKYLQAAIDTWYFIQQSIIDHTNGEWFESVTEVGKSISNMDKIRMWKAPYHNSRMVFEVLNRCNRLKAGYLSELTNVEKKSSYYPTNI